MNIVLIGFMGTGKSAVGHALATRLRARYFDTDAEIEKESGKHVAEIFTHDGEAVFRRLETDVLMRLTREHGPIVVATGGGTPLREENVRLLKMIGPVVWLTAPPQAILGRVRRNLERRPMLASHEHDPLARIQHLLLERTPIYRAIKDYEFDTTNWDTAAETAACILSILGPSKEPCPPPHPTASANQPPKKKNHSSRTESRVTSQPALSQSVNLDLGSRSYEILVRRGLLRHLGAELAARLGGETQGRTAVVLCNPKVELYHGQSVYRSLEEAGFKVVPLVLVAGERYKTLQTVRRIYKSLHAEAADRRTVIVALGGGVIGDVAGFVAATYNRGLDFVQVPTTLLAQVDSSVGGKVGVNFDQGKNLIGAFYQPRFVAIDPDSLYSLPLRERRSGLAEMIKYGIIDDKPFFETMAAEGEKLLRLSSDRLEYAIARSCEIKARVVEQDERDEGLRAILNFGHTVGHALEAITHYRIYRHGEAIAIGMVSAAMIGEEIGLTDPADTEKIRAAFRCFGLPTALDPQLAPGGLLRLMAWDKKAVGGVARFVLMEKLGRVTPGHDVPSEAVLRALERQQTLTDD